MRDELIVLDGSTFFISDMSGDMAAWDCDGFFFADTRHLSHWELLVDGERLDPLSSENVDYYSARIVGTAGRAGHAPPITVQRDRIVSDGVHEDVFVENHTDSIRSVVVELRYAADFVDLFELRSPELRRQRTPVVDCDGSAVTISYECAPFRRATKLAFTVPGDIGPSAARFTVRLEPRERWNLCVDISCLEGDDEHGPRAGHGGFGGLQPQMPTTLDEWMDDAPDLVASDGDLVRTYRQSLLDLAALRFRSSPSDKDTLPAAGLPWFMAVLGRDSILTSYMALPFQPRLAAATLEVLASMQATDDDPFRDAEAGKIPHERRRGELSRLGVMPHVPYYGSHDATPLFLVLLDEYERWTGDHELVRRLEPAARAAIGWIEGPGDRDGDGYLEYHTRSSRGLVNQGWKDSPNAVLFADGRRAEPPIALCEVQGYAYDARRRTARLARTVWGDEALAARLEDAADALAQRFRTDFWCAERGHPALAIDVHGRRVDSLTSNVGHLLWSGILDDEQAVLTAERLRSDDLRTGWGLRSMSASDAGFNPLEYHNGSVWPHDSVIVAEGLRRYSFREQASELALDVLDAAAAFDHRLPELFGGFPRSGTSLPVNYPTASRPQAWSAAASLLALRTILGMDVVDGALRAEPVVPARLGELSLRRVPVRGGRADVVNG